MFSEGSFAFQRKALNEKRSRIVEFSPLSPTGRKLLVEEWNEL